MARWGTKIPPNKEGRYLVTIKTQFGSRQVRQADRREYPEGNWTWHILPSGGSTSDVIAWQKCPDPYIE